MGIKLLTNGGKDFTILHSRIRFQYLNPKPELILIEDIAHSLSNICRFTGHPEYHYSVAHHSVILSYLVSQQNSLWALLHDAAEIYVNDLSSSLKSIIGGRYNKIEGSIMKQICIKFGLPVKEPKEVKSLDHILTINELWALIDDSYLEEGIPKIFDSITPWTAKQSKINFLARFNELMLVKTGSQSGKADGHYSSL
jgi:hypothetical protein